MVVNEHTLTAATLFCTDIVVDERHKNFKLSLSQRGSLCRDGVDKSRPPCIGKAFTRLNLKI